MTKQDAVKVLERAVEPTHGRARYGSYEFIGLACLAYGNAKADEQEEVVEAIGTLLGSTSIFLNRDTGVLTDGQNPAKELSLA